MYKLVTFLLIVLLCGIGLGQDSITLRGLINQEEMFLVEPGTVYVDPGTGIVYEWRATENNGIQLFQVSEPRISESNVPDPPKLTKQEKLFLEGSYWDYGVLSNVSTFYFDGDFKVFESPFAGGIKRVMKELELGAYISPIINSEEGKIRASLGGIIHFSVWKKFGLGFGADFWELNIGFKKPEAFITLGISLTE